MSQSDFVTRGQSLIASGQYQEAVKVCRLGLLGRPTTVEGRIVLGQALLALRRFDEVLAEMRVVLELDHASVAAQLLRAETLIEKGDAAAAGEVLEGLRAVSAEDRARLEILGTRVRRAGATTLSAAESAVQFVAGSPPGLTGTSTRDYAGTPEYTRPTSIAAPSAKQRDRAAPVVKRTATVHIDPELEGIELTGDEDEEPSPRGSVRRATRTPAPGRRRDGREASSIELDGSELEEVEETDGGAETPAPRGPVKHPATMSEVRSAIGRPSGPLEPDLPMVASPRPVDPRSAIAAALPTAAAQPFPSPAYLPLPSPPSSGPYASPAPGAPTDSMFGRAPPPGAPGPGAPAWARPTMVAGSPPGPGIAAPDEPTRHPDMIDPRILAEQTGAPMLPPAAGQPLAYAELPQPTGAPGRALRTGVRRSRSRLAILMWVLIGALVIGGGIFAGFQIRSMRLAKQIAAARTQAVSLAKTDTWQGWSGARERLAGIVRASPTEDNRAAHARTLGVLAYEFGDGLAEARAAVEPLRSSDAVDAAVALAYVALADHDPKAARAAAARALELAPDEAGAHYVAGHAALIDGDVKAAITSLKSSVARDARPLHAAGLGRAYAQHGLVDDGLAAIETALKATPDHPAALIEKALVLAKSGRLGANAQLVTELRTQLQALISEGTRPPAEQPRGISPTQLALAHLARARLEFAARDVTAAMAAIKAAAEVRADSQRFGEEAIDALYAFGELQRAKAAAVVALATWPSSRTARIAQAEIAFAFGQHAEALQMLEGNPDVARMPRGLAVRGAVKRALGDIAGARADLDAALERSPSLELAVVSRAWIDLEDGEVDVARKRLEPRFDETTASHGLSAVYAAVLRRSGDLAGARKLLEATLQRRAAGIDVPTVQLELGRVLRDQGDMRAARAMLADAVRANPTIEARVESALLQIEDADPLGAREALDQLLAKEPSTMSNPRILLEVARARAIAGDHAGAENLLNETEKLASVERWKLDRERGRLALRKSDLDTAIPALMRALDGSGTDPETFFLASDVVTVDREKASQLATKIEALVPARLGTTADALIVQGKLALSLENDVKAEQAYTAAKKALSSSTPRRLAQASFGLAVIAYNRGDDPLARNQLALVTHADPTLYIAYLFAAEISKGTDAQAMELVRKAVSFNPDYIDGWFKLGTLAHKLGRAKDLAQAIRRLGELAPSSPQLAELKAL